MFFVCVDLLILLPNVHTKRYLDTCISEKAKTSYILEQREYLI
jgi:hypothetical protein